MLVAFGTQWFEDEVGKPHSIRWYPESFTVSRSECDVMIVRACIQGWNGSNKVPSPIVRRIFFVPPKLRIAHAVRAGAQRPFDGS